MTVQADIEYAIKEASILIDATSSVGDNAIIKVATRLCSQPYSVVENVYYKLKTNKFPDIHVEYK